MKIKTQQLTMAGVLAALVFVATLFLSVPVGYGYIHLGDTFVYFCGALLGPFGALPAALGSMLADLSAGYVIYALPTLIIKGLDALVVALLITLLKRRRTEGKLNLLDLIMATAPGGIVMVVGYFLTELFLYGYGGAAAAVVPNIVQAVGGIVFFVLFYYPMRGVLDKIGLNN